MNKTTIEWVRNPDGTQGYTWNVITGCLNHDNGLCKGGGFPCYAYKLANGRLKPLYLANGNITDAWKDGVEGFAFKEARADPFYPRFWEERLTPLHIPRKANSPRKGIFLCDMGELFGDWIPQSWQEQIFNAIKANPDYRFYLLTKQAQNLIKFSPFPDNCWAGVTVCNDKMLDVAVDKLEDIQARAKFISFEPLLERLTLSLDYAFYYSGISWLIIGACTGTMRDMIKVCQAHPELTLCGAPRGRWTAQPRIEWVREIVEAADKAGVKVFLKDNLRPLLKNAEGWTPAWAVRARDSAGNEWLRQELPEGK